VEAEGRKNGRYKKEKGMIEVLREEEKGGGRLWSYLNVVPDSKEMEHYLVSISVLYMITWNTQYSAYISTYNTRKTNFLVFLCLQNKYIITLPSSVFLQKIS
jgi:hypothetical protein